MSLDVRRALFTKLSEVGGITAKVGTRIFHEQAPPGATYPLVIFQKSAGTKVRALQTPEAFKRDVWMIKAVDRSTSSNLVDEIAEAIDTLDGGSLSVSGKVVADLSHIGDVEYLEVDGDQQYRHSGASYRITLTAA